MLERSHKSDIDAQSHKEHQNMLETTAELYCRFLFGIVCPVFFQRCHAPTLTLASIATGIFKQQT